MGSAMDTIMSEENPTPLKYEDLLGSGAHWFKRQIACLKQRKVPRVAIAYSLTIWLIVQVGDVGLPLFEIPESSMTYLVLVGLLGLPVAMVLAWMFEITPHGIVLDRRRTHEPANRAEIFANTLFLIAGAGLACMLILHISTESSATATQAREGIGSQTDSMDRGDATFVCLSVDVRNGQLVLKTHHVAPTGQACPPAKIPDRLVNAS